MALLDTQTYEIIYITSDFKLSEAEIDELYDHCLVLPSRYDINEYHMMQHFVASIEDDQTYNRLVKVITGRGAFRRFKDECFYLGIINDWYKFRDEKYKQIAIDWCEENHIEYE